MCVLPLLWLQMLEFSPPPYSFQGRPFLCTFFVSNKVNLHPTRAEKVEGLLQNHSGEMIFPPQEYSRVLELGPMEDFFFEVSVDSLFLDYAIIIILLHLWQAQKLLNMFVIIVVIVIEMGRLKEFLGEEPAKTLSSQDLVGCL